MVRYSRHRPMSRLLLITCIACVTALVPPTKHKQRLTVAHNVASAKPNARNAKYVDQLLDVANIEDWSGAANGLQVENAGKVKHIAAAVDASTATVKKAIAAKADLLIVHHGLFWGPTTPWTGRNYRLLKLLLDNNLAVYSSHLPLDLHAKLGNSAKGGCIPGDSD